MFAGTRRRPEWANQSPEHATPRSSHHSKRSRTGALWRERSLCWYLPDVSAGPAAGSSSGARCWIKARIAQVRLRNDGGRSYEVRVAMNSGLLFPRWLPEDSQRIKDRSDAGLVALGQHAPKEAATSGANWGTRSPTS